jgi:hypothetical protein
MGDLGDTRKAAKAVVDAVLKELDGRRGIGQELRGIASEFPDTWRELKQACIDAADEALWKTLNP